jgi:MFS family permease
MAEDSSSRTESPESSGDKSLLAYAVICQLAMWTGAALFIPTIPLYLRHLKATDVQIGQYLATTMVSLSLGPVLIGWLSDKLHIRDRLVVACYALQVPIAYAMGNTDNLLIACLLNMGMWTFGASAVNLTRAIVALNFSKQDRNRVFALIAITSPVSFVIGGFFGGRIVDAYGYPGLFKIMAACWLVAAVVGVGIKDRYVLPEQKGPQEASIKRPIVLFCSAILLQSLFFQWSEIALPLKLSDKGFSLPFITSMYSISNLVSIPFVILGGRYAGRIGNVNLLIGGAVILSVSRFGLGFYDSEYQVIGLQIITGIPTAFVHSIAVAVIAGMGPDRTVGSRMSFLMMSGGIGGALGGLVGGYLLAAFGPAGLLMYAGGGLLGVAVFFRFAVVDPSLEQRE